MTVTTSARFNSDALQAALPAGAGFVATGADVTAAAPKDVTFYGTDDATGQAAVSTAAGQFVDRVTNKATMQSRAQTALAANATYLAIGSPTSAQVAAQVALLTKECNGIIRLALNLLDTITGT